MRSRLLSITSYGDSSDYIGFFVAVGKCCAAECQRMLLSCARLLASWLRQISTRSWAAI